MKFNECLLNNWLLFQLMALCSLPVIKCQVLGKVQRLIMIIIHNNLSDCGLAILC